MSSSALAAGIRHLRGKLAAQQPSSDSDEQLLHAFTSRRDDNAFAALMYRHGPMVLHVCRRVLGHEQDAEDAFQATFLVFAQNAASLRKKASLASFLYGTAYRIAMKAKQTAARRRKHEGQAPARSPQNLTDELSWREVRMLLEEEIARLPEKYRVVFVLFYLENLSREETARRLGLKDATVAKRLAQARKRLGQRLTRRGVELTAALSAAALATPSASALPASLMATTIKAALAGGEGLSASVAELVQCATTTVLASKAKIVMIFLLTATLLAGAGVWTWRSQALSESDQQVAKTPTTPSRSAQGQKAQTPQQEQRDSITVTGRVLDPGGTPVKGARLYWPRSPKKNPKSEEDIEFPVRARTDADGQFRFELPRSDFHPDWNFALVAAADGYGVDAVELSEDDSAAVVTLRLVKDQPIEGRIVSTEGKPLASVRVRVSEISAMRQGRLDDFLMAWQQDWGFAFGRFPRHRFLMPEQKSSPALTDKEGRFRIAGAGADRFVELRLSGPGIAHQSLQIVNRAGFDAAAVNKTALDRAHVEIGNSRPPLLYGPTFTYVASAGRRIEGTVRQAGSGKPVEGYVIYCCDSVCGGTVSGKDGCYQLEGAPKRKQYLLSVEPPAGSSWLPTGARPEDEEGLRPLHVDFTVARGITLRGRVLDRTTGRGVRGEVHFVLLPGNNFAGKPGFNRYHYGIMGTKTETDGQFQLAVIPGPSVLMFQAYAGAKANGGQELNPYKQAEFDAKERERVQLTERGNDERYFTTIDRSIQFLNSQNAVKYIDLAPDAGTAKCDLFVDRGAMQTINIEDADGKPLTGTMASGVTAKYPTACTIKDAACTAFALNSKMPRRLYFFHAQRQLAGSLTVRGDEKEPLTVRLLPVGTVTGRLLNREGQPIVGAFVDLHTLEGTYGSARELYRVLQQRRPPIRTDKDGRFRLEGIVPDVRFMLRFSQGRTFFGGEPPIGVRQVKPGETLDLGAIRVKPAG